MMDNILIHKLKPHVAAWNMACRSILRYIVEKVEKEHLILMKKVESLLILLKENQTCWEREEVI